jgi:hypothetical protein
MGAMTRFIIHEATYRFASVSPCIPQFLEQLAFGPGRFAASVPFHKHRQSLRISERESADETTTDPKRANVAVLSRNRWRDRSHVAPSSIEQIGVATRSQASA